MRFPITTFVLVAIMAGFSSCGEENKTNDQNEDTTTQNDGKEPKSDLSSDVATNEIPVNSSPDLPNSDGQNASEASKKDGKVASAYDPAKEQVPSELALIVFEEEVYDFGTLNEGESVTHIFKFTNGGNVPLTLQNCKGSCGCTVPQCPKAPIMPGEGGEIEVKFNSKGKKNAQTKTVTINANIPGDKKILTIKANVTPAS